MVIMQDVGRDEARASGASLVGTAPRAVRSVVAEGAASRRVAAFAAGLVSFFAFSAVAAAPLTVADLDALEFKTVNGVSIRGRGDIAAPGAGSYRNVEDVTLHGAVGDGRTDDTKAIMAAAEAARASGRPLYFPRNGGNCTYLTRKGIVLTSGMKVTSDPGVVIRSASATLDGGGKTLRTPLAEPAPQGATRIVVENPSGLVPGQEITIGVPCPSYRETQADVVSVDGNTIEIDTSRFTADGRNGGILYDCEAGTLVLTDFSLIKTVVAREAVNVMVENVTLQTCGNPDDPYVYTISPIHQTAQGRPTGQNTLRIRNVTIDGSTQDGISTQGSGDIWVENCVVRDVRHKGIHWGTSCDRVIVRGNYLLRCGSATAERSSGNGGTGALYFCVNNHRVLIEGNHVQDCYKGVFGYDYRGNGETDMDSVVAGNTFQNCGHSGVFVQAGRRLVLRGNVFRRFGGEAVPILATGEGKRTAIKSGLRASVIAENAIGDFQKSYSNTNGAIQIEWADGLALYGNVVEANTNAAGSAAIRVAHSSNVAINGNVAGGGLDVSAPDNRDVSLHGNTVAGGGK